MLFGRRPLGARSTASLALIVAVGLCAAPALADPADALPPGPKQSLAAVVGDDQDALAALLAATHSAEEWHTQLSADAHGLDDSQIAALADYLAYNVPPPNPVAGQSVAEKVAALPADGRELFLNSCFSCHGVEAYYLTQDRDQAGWMSIFDAPYHRRLLTGDNERETFASYAAHAMPIPADKVPAEWQDKK